MLIPLKKLEHLGFVLNSEDMTVNLSSNKRVHISDLIQSTIQSNSLTVRDIAIVVGTLIVLELSVRPVYNELMTTFDS